MRMAEAKSLISNFRQRSLAFLKVALAQRRNDHGHDVEAVEVVFADAALRDGFFQVGVGGGYESDVDLDVPRAP